MKAEYNSKRFLSVRNLHNTRHAKFCCLCSIKRQTSFVSSRFVPAITAEPLNDQNYSHADHKK